MDEDRIKGAAENVGGKIKEAAGKLVGDSKLQGEGVADQAEGRVQNTVGGRAQPGLPELRRVEAAAPSLPGLRFLRRPRDHRHHRSLSPASVHAGVCT